MKELANISATNIVEKLIGLPYAFASWKMPGSNESTTIISLSKANQTLSPLSEIRPGFLFNKFTHNHPAHPFHISGDLVVVNKSIHVSSQTNATEIDAFKEALNSSNSSIIHNQAEVNTPKADNFESLVAKAISSISNEEFEKVVLARFEESQLPEGFDLIGYYERLCDHYPNAFVSMVHLPGEGIWIGASPELLLSDNGSEFRTIALAGTKALLPNQKLTEIAWTQKEIEEQAFVSRYIINCFKQLRLREFEEKGPKTVQAGNLVHLKTEYIVNYKDLNFEQLADQMLGLLHPTSAVCGMPLASAKQFIEENEAFDRSFYSGFLGPVNMNGSTDLFVNLRCANIKGSTIRFFAGAGITEDSDPVHEKAETNLKMSVLKQLIN